jgi:hypothetical protein
MQRLSKIDDGSGRVGDFFIVSSSGSVAFLGCTECNRSVHLTPACMQAGVSCARHERERGLYKPAYAREQQMYKASCARHAEYRERVCIVHD